MRIAMISDIHGNATAFDAGADAVLVKPCLPEILLDEIHRVIAISLDLRRRDGQTTHVTELFGGEEAGRPAEQRHRHHRDHFLGYQRDATRERRNA